MPDTNIDVINRVYDAFNSRNYSQVISLFDSDMEWIAAESSPLADGSPYRGTKAISTGVFDRIDAGFDKLIVLPGEVFEAVDHVVVLGHYEGRFKGTPDEFRTQVAHIWTLRAGKPIKFQQYVDTLKIAHDSGRIPAPHCG